MSEELKLSIDSLIKDELDGKASAIMRYDEMLWRIRTGYAVLLYGAVGIVAGLVNQKAITLNSKTALSAIVLVVGFSAFGALLDYSFISAKLRVVTYRDWLVEIAYSKTTGGSIDSAQNNKLLECLKNSGERNESVDWTNKVGRWIPLIYYGGTGVICTSAIFMLIMACQ
jgi:hypothetical protein